MIPPVPEPVWLSTLHLSHFRNYARMQLAVAPGPVVLVGPNGAGKTNILEAVSFLAPGRGLRHASLVEANQAGTPHPWAVFARVHQGGEVTEIGTGRDADALAQGQDKRRVRINGADAGGQGALEDCVPQVWLTPKMDRLFQGGAAERRRFLDRMVYGFYPAHLQHLRRYEQLLRERGRLLEQPRPDAVWLDTLESQLATEAVAVAASRRDVLARLNASCAGTDSPFPRAWLACAGMVEESLAGQTALVAEDGLRASLAAHRSTPHDTPGPHRSDLQAWHLDKDIPADLCSTGEQKALLLRIILSNANAMHEQRGVMPLLLLDEVTAHLDPGRRAALFVTLKDMGVQAWLTGTETAVFAGVLEDATVVRVEDGRVVV